MLVGEDWHDGTIGGGALEFRAIEHARQMLIDGDAEKEISLPLGPALAQCCGGYVKLKLWLDPSGAQINELVERAQATWPELWLFGAGHVGTALIHVLGPLPVRVTWIDGRRNVFGLTGKQNIHLRNEEPVPLAAHMPKDAACLVMTHDHGLDLGILEMALQNGHRGFLGLIGSASKKARFAKQLRAQGLDPDRVTCPIGLPAIAGKEPAVIATSVAAQLLALFESRV